MKNTLTLNAWIVLLGAVFFMVSSCGGTECRCAETHQHAMATSGAEEESPKAEAEDTSEESPQANPYSKWGSAEDAEPTTKKKGAHASLEEEVPSKADWKELVRRGQRRYDKACGNCHPDGEEDLGPAIIDLRWSVARMTKQIRNGSGKMKPISTKRLPESEMEPLMAYLSSIRAVKGVAQP